MVDKYWTVHVFVAGTCTAVRKRRVVAIGWSLFSFCIGKTVVHSGRFEKVLYEKLAVASFFTVIILRSKVLPA